MQTCYFPVDEHNCSITFSVLSYNQNQVKLAFDPKRIIKGHGDRTDTGTWGIELSTCSDTDRNVSCCKQISSADNFVCPTAQFSLELKRKPAYYLINVCLPITFLGLVSTSSIALPPDSGERSTVLITCLLAYFVYLDTVWKHLPESSDYVPLMIYWILLILINIIFQLFLCYLVSSWSQAAQEKKRLGKRSRVFIIGILKKLLFLSVKQIMRTLLRKRPSVSTQNVSMIQVQPVNEAPPAREMEPTNPATPVDADITSCSQDETVVVNEHTVAIKILDRLSILISIIFIALGPTIFGLLIFGKWTFLNKFKEGFNCKFPDLGPS